MDAIEVSRARTSDTVRLATRPWKAAALVEYALILSLVSVLAIGSLALVVGSVNGIFGSVAAALGPGPHDNGCHGRAGCHDNNGGGNDDGNKGNGKGDEEGNSGGGKGSGGRGGPANGNGGGKGSGK